MSPADRGVNTGRTEKVLVVQEDTGQGNGHAEHTECPPQPRRGLEVVRFPILYLDPCSPTRITNPPYRAANPLRKASRIPGKCPNANASFSDP